jgi:hypothetical protein
MGKYGRLAMATHLLCRVFQHISEVFPDESMQAEDSLQLNRTLHAAITLCDLEGRRRGFSCCAPVDICQQYLICSSIPPLRHGLTLDSALLILHATSATSKSMLSYNKSAAHDLAITRRVAQNIVASSQIFLDSVPEALKQVSPIVLHSPYKAASVYITLNRESPSVESLQALETLKAALAVKNRKWKVAGMLSLFCCLA